MPIRAEIHLVRPSHRRIWPVYIVCALALVSLLGWATLNELARSPTRDAVVDLGPYGLVTIRFSTDPNPALPTGLVRLKFMPVDSRQVPVTLDSLSFEYGREGNDQPVGIGEAQPMSDSSGL